MAAKSLGTLTLDLVAKVGSFEQGMDKASRKAKSSSKEMSSAADEAGAAWKKVAPIVGAAFSAFGAGSATAFIQSAMKEQEQLQRNMLRTEAVIKATGAAAGLSAQELHQQARQLALATLQSTEGVMQAQQVLLSYSSITGDVFERAIGTAADLATLIGGPLNGSLEMLAKTLDNPIQGINALRRQGIYFTEDQQKVIKALVETNQLAEAQGLILDELAGQFGGIARKEAEGLAGAQDTLGQRIQEAKLALADQLQLTDRATAVYNSMSSTVLSLGENMDVVIVAGEAVALVIGSRIVAASGAATAAFVAGQVQAARYQAALARMAGVSATTAASLAAMGAAARVANGALSLVGGPAGAAILAAGALVYFATRASEAERESEALDKRIGALGDSFERLTVNQAQRGIQDYQDKLQKAADVMKTAEARAFTLADNLSRFPGSKKAEEWRRDLVGASAAVDDAKGEVDQLNSKLAELQTIVNQGGIRQLGEDSQTASESFSRLARQMDERLLVLGKSTEAERLAAKVAAGYVEGLIEGEGEILVAKQRQIDATEEQIREQERAAAAAKSASESAAKRAASEAEAISEQIAALELQAAQYGWTAAQLEVYELRTRGATDAQLAQAEAALNAVAALEKQAESVRALNEAEEQTNRDAVSIIESLQTEEEAIRQSYERRRQIIMDATLLTAEERNEALLRLEQEHNEQMLQVNGSYWERYLAAAEENLQNFDELSGVMLENFTGRFGDAFESMVFDAESLGDAVHGLAEGMARSVINALGQMAAQWLAYQAVQLIVGKTTQASAASTMTFNALASQQMAAINAFASTAAIPIVGPVMAPAAATAAIAATSPMVGAVASLSLAGMAHEGIDAIPETGTWLLEKGERVTTAETSAKLDKTLSDIQQGGSGAPIVNLYEDSAKAGQVNSRQENGQNVIDIFVSNIMSDGKAQQAISRKFGIQGVGQ